MLNTIYIGLGSNVGDRQYYIDEALEKLSSIQDVEVTLISSRAINLKFKESFSFS